MQQFSQRLVKGHRISDLFFLWLPCIPGSFRWFCCLAAHWNIPRIFSIFFTGSFLITKRRYFAFFRFLIIRRLILGLLCFCIGDDIRHFLCLIGKFFISLVVFLLLRRCKLLVLHLQFHSFVYILSLAEPENEIITFLQTLRCHARFLVQFCQFVRPLFNIFGLLILLERFDLLLNGRSLRPQNLISQNILIRIFGGYLYEIIIIINRLIYIPSLEGKRTESADDLAAPLGTAVSEIQHVITFLIFFVLFINITDICQHRRIADTFPVDRVRYICGFSV